MAKIKIIDFDSLKIFKNKIVTLFESHTSDNDIHTSAEDKTKLSQAYTHSTSTHAPTNAEKKYYCWSTKKMALTCLWILLQEKLILLFLQK